MSRFARRGRHSVTAVFSANERMLLAGLAEQLIEVLADESDPAQERLLPNAYPDDAEAAAEFRRFTAEGLTGRKVENARAMLDALDAAHDGVPDGSSHPVVLDEQHAVQWLRTLTDLRLTIASRLGIERDDDEGRTDEAAMGLQYSYHWVGELQESLVSALDR